MSSTLDLNSDYLQVEGKERFRRMTAFTEPRELCQLPVISRTGSKRQGRQSLGFFRWYSICVLHFEAKEALLTDLLNRQHFLKYTVKEEETFHKIKPPYIYK